MEELLRTINDIQPMAPSFGAMIALILSGFLLFLSGYASGSEIAFFSLSPADLSELEEEKTERDRQILPAQGRVRADACHHFDYQQLGERDDYHASQLFFLSGHRLWQGILDRVYLSDSHLDVPAVTLR